MKKEIKHIILIHITLLLSIFFYSCSSSNSSKPWNTMLNPQRYSTNLFGANLDWNSLAGKTMTYGDLVRDRSFRSKADTATFVQIWGEVKPAAGTITWNTTDQGDPSPAGGKSYTGYVELSQATAGYTGITQQLQAGVKSGSSYILNFSSYGVGAGASIGVYLYNAGYTVLASATATAVAGTWSQHELTLTPNADASASIIAIYVTDVAAVRIDEVRLAQAGGVPTFSEVMKTAIGDLGVKALRWPGGTLGDWFDWSESIGGRINRGELRAYGHYETPALGLHEFLDLCEELNLQPLIQVNVLGTADNAANLVEYVLGDETTTQGALRIANGRAKQWNVRFFEIGNEPAESYASDLKANTGADYASLAKTIITAMKTKAQTIGKTIKVGVINEASFQKAAWLVQGGSDVIDLLYNWNEQVFDNTSGITFEADFTHGHFYSSRYYSTDAATNFKNVMSGGELLVQTINEKVATVTDLPFWLTEYHVVLEDSGVVQAAYLKDFQAGLGVADILMRTIEYGAKGAYIYNLVDLNGFGMLRDENATVLRPSGLAFKLVAVMANEVIRDVSIDTTSTYTIPTAFGNVPADFSYPLVSALASVNAATGKNRALLINRSYDTDITVTVTLQGYSPGDATCYYLNNSDINANNETVDTTVAITSENATFSSPFIVTVPAHTLMRVDF